MAVQFAFNAVVMLYPRLIPSRVGIDDALLLLHCTRCQISAADSFITTPIAAFLNLCKCNIKKHTISFTTSSPFISTFAPSKHPGIYFWTGIQPASRLPCSGNSVRSAAPPLNTDTLFTH